MSHWNLRRTSSRSPGSAGRHERRPFKLRQLRGGDPGIDDQRAGPAVDDDRQVPEQLASVDEDPIRGRCQHAIPLPAGARAELDEQLVQLVERLGVPARRPGRDRGVERLLRWIAVVDD